MNVIWGPDEHHVHTPKQLRALAEVMRERDEYADAVDKWAERCVDARRERDEALRVFDASLDLLIEELRGPS